MRFLRFSCFAFAILCLTVGMSQGADKPNVLFIAVDDLNDWVGCLGGNPQAKTPHIDALAARGVNFRRAYCASPVCNPSRSALMSGLRSSTSGVYSNSIDWRKQKSGEVTTLNQQFKANGYYVAGAGKIYHESFARRGPTDWDDYGGGRRGQGDAPRRRGGQPSPPAGASGGVGGIRFGAVDAQEEEMEDYHIVDYCIEQLQKKQEKPFFLACGLHKPHMPWYVPRKYFDMFPLESIKLPEVPENDLDDIPRGGIKMAQPKGDHRAIVESGRWKEAVQGYLAAGAFCDAMIGRLIDAFDKSAYKENTIIVFWGDHGWHLGEKQHWRKFALWEEATRAPLFFIAPGVTKPKSTCDRTVDFMGIYPTLCELCSIPVPKHVEGVSLLPLLKDPQAKWDRPALTTHGYQNHAVRSEKWRYIRYEDGGEELYDEELDPMEWKNLADKPEFAAVKAELGKWMPQENVPTPLAEKKQRRQGQGAE